MIISKPCGKATLTGTSDLTWHTRDHLENGYRDFPSRDFAHAAKIKWALTQKTGAALHVVAQNAMTGTQWTGSFWLG
jgi:hypothetical protein